MSEFSAQYWRDRAAATVVKADRRWIDEAQKFKLLRVAREYDKLADLAALKELHKGTTSNAGPRMGWRSPRN
jgi:hypothetical protein